MLGHNAGGLDLDALRLRARQRRSLQCPQQREGGAGTICFETIPPEGITVGASDVDGWTLYGFAADDVVGVDVVLGGKATAGDDAQERLRGGPRVAPA